MTDDELRATAAALLNEHNPDRQEGNGYNRCAFCHYTRHPCDVYWLADQLIQILDERPAP